MQPPASTLEGFPCFLAGCCCPCLPQTSSEPAITELLSCELCPCPCGGRDLLPSIPFSLCCVVAMAEAAAAAPYAQVMEDMAKGREYATQLQALLRDSSPEAGRLLDRILHAMARTIDTAKAAASAAEEQEASEVQSDVTCAGTTGGKRKASASGGDKRPATRKRNNQSSVVTKNAKDLEDGHAWRKYGQKEIQNCKFPKAYFRCTHKYDQNCLAQRQVQRRDDDPEFYTVTYIGAHTCRDPATAVASLVGHADGAGEIHHAGSRLISFAAANANGNASAATTSTTTTGNTTGHKEGAAALLARPMKLEGGSGGGGGEQEEVLSSLTPAGNAAAATTPGGPDQGDVTSGLQQQFYGGDDVADMAAQLGYDDTFDWMAVCSDSITDIYADEY